MYEKVIDDLIGRAFQNSKKGREWEGIININGKKITLNGSFQNGEISSAFIKEIN